MNNVSWQLALGIVIGLLAAQILSRHARESAQARVKTWHSDWREWREVRRAKDEEEDASSEDEQD